MKKTAFLLFFAACIIAQRVPAQNASADTASAIVVDKTPSETAREDVKIFKLPVDVLKRFRKARFPKTSDYFKPTKQYASNYALLSDSNYVQTFRKAAYNRSLRQPVHPTGTFFLVFGSVVGGIALIVVLLGAIFRGGIYGG